MLTFDFPWLLVGLPIIAMVALIRRSVPRPSAVSFPLADFSTLPRPLRQKLLWAPEAIRVIAIGLLIVAAAGPHWGAVRVTDETRGIAIELVIDRSSSMSLSDLDYKSRHVSRLDAVKDIAREFLLGNGSDLKGRSGDAIGVVSFAARPQSLSPLVSHREAALAQTIDSLDIAHGMEDATAIGDAIALAAARLRVTEQARAISFNSKIVILLTDGQQNEGTKSLGEAARLAATWGVRIYSVGIRPVSEGEQRDDEVGYGLDALAATTNGMSVMATDGEGLRRFFSTIDRLEPNTIPSAELNGGWSAAPAVISLAFALICCQIGLRETWMRTSP